MSASAVLPPAAEPTFPRWVIVLSVATALSSAIPQVYQALTVPPGQVFTGCVESVDDQNAYLTRVEQVRRGRVFVQDLATAEETPQQFANPPWLIIGLIARAIPLPTIVIYQAVRVLWAFGYLLLIWLLVRSFFQRPAPRLFAFIIASLGSGLGWLADLINYVAGRELIYSADIMPELWAYHSLQIPHFVLAEALIVLLVLTLLRGWRRPGPLIGPAVFGLAALLIYVHPFDVGVLAPLLVGHFLLCRFASCAGGRHTGVNLWAVAGMIAPAAFYLWELHTDPVVAAWNAQNVLRSPSSLSYLLGLGIVLPLAAMGPRMLRERGRAGADTVFFLLWPLITAVAVYAYPVYTFERRCVEGLHLPLALLAGIAVSDWLVPGLRGLLPRLSHRGATALALVLVLLGILPTNIKLLVDQAGSELPVIPAGWLEGFAWIDANTPPDARVFTDHRVGSFLTRYALRHVHFGHWQLTIDVTRKRDLARRFFAADTRDAERLEILRAAGCGWVAAMPQSAGRLAHVRGLSVVYANNDLVVLRLADQPPPPALGPR